MVERTLVPGGHNEITVAQADALTALLERYPKQVRLLSDQAPLYLMRTLVLKISGSAREAFLQELGQVQGLAVYPLSELLNTASAGQAPELKSPEELKVLRDRIGQGPLPERLRAFSELAAALETSAPARIAALPEGSRDEMLGRLDDLAGTVVATFDSTMKNLWEHLLRRHGVDADKALPAALASSPARTRLEPLRALYTRLLGAMDRLDTRSARLQVLRKLPNARYAGLGYIASRAELTRKYVLTWFNFILDSVLETVAGLETDRAEGGKWKTHAPVRGYEHLEGARNLLRVHADFDPGQLPNHILWMLGMPAALSGMAGMVLELIRLSRSRVPEINLLNRARKIREEFSLRSADLEMRAARAAQDGHPIPDEELESKRGRIRREIAEEYDRGKTVEGHVIIDELLRSLSYNRRLAFIPSFDEGAYVSAILGIFSEGIALAHEPGLLKQVLDSAITFLVDLLQAGPLLESNQALQARTIALWEQVGRAARDAGLTLKTNLSGVIRPRPQRLGGAEPLTLQGHDAGYAVWQVADSPDGRYIASAGADRKVLIWDAASGALLKSIKLDDAEEDYGDAPNSLGVAWTPDGKLLVTTYHEKRRDGSFNKARIFDLSGSQEALGTNHALSETVVPGAYSIQRMPLGPEGQYLATTIDRRAGDGTYVGSDIRLFGQEGAPLASIADSVLLDLERGLALAGAPRNAAADKLELWDLSDPSQPRDVTPPWLRQWVISLRPASALPSFYAPRLEARLGRHQGRPALLHQRASVLSIYDLETGNKLAAIQIPDSWEASIYATDPSGRYLAASIAPQGGFVEFDRLAVWDLATGEMVMDRASGETSWISFSRDGGRLVAASPARIDIFPLP